MQLTREHFSAGALAVMDQVARLLYVAEKALDLVQTFKNNKHKAAAKPMRLIVKFANDVSVLFTEALFHTEDNRRNALNAALEFARSKVASAIEAAQRLATMERADTDEKGTVIANGVLPNLEQLRQEWESAIEIYGHSNESL